MRILFIVLIFCLSSTFSRGQTLDSFQPDASDSTNLNYNLKITKTNEDLHWYKMFENIPDDYYEFFGSKNGIINFSPLLETILFTSALFPVDREAYNFQRDIQNRYSSLNNVSDYTVFMGDGKFNLSMAGLFSIYGFAFDDNRALKTSSNIVESVIATGILVQVFKRIFGRESPAAASKHFSRWDLFPNPKEYQKDQPRFYAFPSGHIATITATVTAIVNNYPECSWIKPIGYSAIGLVGVSLVNKGMHWYSDLPLGIYLGYTIGNIIVPKKESKYNSEALDIIFYPAIMADKTTQLGILYHF